MLATKIGQPKLVDPAYSLETLVPYRSRYSRFANFSEEGFAREKLCIENDINARLTRGNIPTQQGHFITQRDLDAMRDQMAADLKSAKSATK